MAQRQRGKAAAKMMKPEQRLMPWLSNDHQQYLAKPGSRPYCSAQPSGQRLGDFPGAAYRLDPRVWDHYDWRISHCVLQGDNAPIQLG